MNPSIYEEEEYKFLTEENNFIYAHELSEKLPLITKRLLIDFWDIVGKKINARLTGENFMFSRDQDIFRQNFSKFKIHYKNFESIAFAYENIASNISIGIFMEPSKFEDKVNEIFDLVKEQYKWNSYSPWWPTYRHLDYNFQQFNTLIRTLPTNRESFAEEMASQLVEFAHNNENLYREIIKIVQPDITFHS